MPEQNDARNNPEPWFVPIFGSTREPSRCGPDSSQWQHRYEKNVESCGSQKLAPGKPENIRLNSRHEEIKVKALLPVPYA
jgi:hypothetical protein